MLNRFLAPISAVLAFTLYSTVHLQKYISVLWCFFRNSWKFWTISLRIVLFLICAFTVGEGVRYRVVRALACRNQGALSPDEREGPVWDPVRPQRRHYGPCGYLYHSDQSSHRTWSHGTTQRFSAGFGSVQRACVMRYNTVL